LSSSSKEATVYVPEDYPSKFKHEESFYVDIISKDDSGIKSVRTHVEPNAYEFEDITEDDIVFYTPKFTWDSSNASNASSESFKSSTFPGMLIWGGSNNGTLTRILFSDKDVRNFDSIDIGGSVNSVVFGKHNHFMYITTPYYLYRYGVDVFAYNGNEDWSDNYLGTDYLSELYSVPNEDGVIISLYNQYDDSLWSLDSYSGNVIKMDPEDFSVQGLFGDFASPFKIRYSEYHGSYFIADSYVLWEMDRDGNRSAVCQVNDYKLSDFDISSDGRICVVLSGYNEGVIRVLDNDKYTILLDYREFESNLRFCTYCNEGKFYVFGELYNDSAVYSAYHYVFDTVNDTLSKIESSDTLVATTTTTTLGKTTNPIEVISPNGAEEIQIGDEYQIKWISEKSSNDSVKIDLYKGGVFYENIIGSVANTGLYAWEVPSDIEEGSDYKIRVTWLSASSNDGNYDDSNLYFSILDSVTETTTTTTLPQLDRAIGVSYEEGEDQVVVMLKSGLFLIYNISIEEKYISYGNVWGVYDSDSGIADVLSVATKNYHMEEVENQNKVRVFVGSEPHYSDRWDSGIVETGLKSMYYGGGNNLVPGKKYYVHIQTHSDKNGWGELQIKEFVMVK